MKNIIKEVRQDVWVLGRYEIFRDEYKNCLKVMRVLLRVDYMNQ